MKLEITSDDEILFQGKCIGYVHDDEYVSVYTEADHLFECDLTPHEFKDYYVNFHELVSPLEEKFGEVGYQYPFTHTPEEYEQYYNDRSNN